MTEHERFLTVEQLLERWAMDARTLDKIVEVGGLGYFRPVGVRVRRFPLSVVVAYEQQHFSNSTTLHLGT